MFWPVPGRTRSRLPRITPRLLGRERKLHRYIDPTGTPTICYGHTGPDVKPGMTLTDEECLELLEKDMKWAFAAIDRRVQVPLTRGQTVWRWLRGYSGPVDLI